jgi:hypothetical protein
MACAKLPLKGLSIVETFTLVTCPCGARQFLFPISSPKCLICLIDDNFSAKTKTDSYLWLVVVGVKFYPTTTKNDECGKVITVGLNSKIGFQIA